MCTRLRQQLRRVWIQGYVTVRDGDDVVDVDDGTAVMSLDVGDLLRGNLEVGAMLQAGRYVSCVCSLREEHLGHVLCGLRGGYFCEGGYCLRGP